MGLQIGFDKNSTAVFEGQFLRGRVLSPAPFFTNCQLTLSSVAQSLKEDKKPIVTGVFREDSFDPVSRIRRGRMYVEGSQQPMEWSVSINPVQTTLKTYFNYSLIRGFSPDTWNELILFLGDGEYRKAWKVVDVEPISTGEELFTIKSLSFFSFLPTLKKVLIISI